VLLVVRCKLLVGSNATTNNEPLTTNVDRHMLRLFVAKRQVIAAKPELDRVAQRRASNHFYAGAVAEAHFEQAAAEVGIAADGDDAAPAPDAELIQPAGCRVTAVIAPGQITGLDLLGLFHGLPRLHARTTIGLSLQYRR